MALKIGIYTAAEHTHQVKYAQMMRQGFKRHGIDVEIKNPLNYTPCDLAIFWGHRKNIIIAGQKKIGRDYLVMERAYIGDRFHWLSLGFNGLNGRASFPAVDDGGARWQKHFSGILKPWRKGGEFILLVGQVPGDAALANVNINQWYREALSKMLLLGQPIRFRPHPVAVERRISQIPVYVPVDTGDLAGALARASHVVTFSSNTAVDAAIAGVPVVAADQGSMAWDIAGHDVGAVPPSPDRKQWAHRMAYKQWLPEEIISGEAWDILKRKYE